MDNINSINPIDNYINDNLDSIIDNLNDDTLLYNIDNSDNITDEIEDKDIMNYYKEELINNENIIKQESANEKYYTDLINTFMTHYNNKYNKSENFFSNINDGSETNSQMEIFYESVYELTSLKEKLGYLNEIECMDYIFEKEKYNNNKVESLYCLDITDKKLYTPALIIALNYIIINNIENWNIFNLKEF